MMTNPSLNYQGKELEAMAFAENYHRWILDEFEPYLGQTVAEVGAGIGSVSRLLLAKPIGHLSAFEPSLNMYPSLDRELQGESRATAVNDFFHHERIRRKFDSVLYINVLEHIADDRIELSNVFQALKTDGHLLLFVPALAWLYSKVDREVGHYRRYEKKGLSRLVEEAGFRIVTVRYFDVAGILPWYLNFVLLRNSFSTKSVSLYDNLVVPTARRVEKALPPPIGKNLLLIARKT